MELCNSHWEELQTALKLHGLWELQIHDKDKVEQFQRRLNGEMREGDDAMLFDSVVAAQMVIFQSALDVVGMKMLFSEEGICPLCLSAKDGRHDVTVWINAACSGIHKAAVENGMIKETLQ